MQLYHLTLNGILNIAKFYWACMTFGAEPDIDYFCTYYELHNQPKRIVSLEDGEMRDAQFTRCTFIPMRPLKG